MHDKSRLHLFAVLYKIMAEILTLFSRETSELEFVSVRHLHFICVVSS